jgi:hypothetical protein
MHGLFAQHPGHVLSSQPLHAKSKALGMPSRAFLSKSAQGGKCYAAGCVRMKELNLPALLKNHPAFCIHLKIPL